MTANALKPNSDDRDRAYRSRVRDEPLPAVIIDCMTATVMAANAGGLNALGLTPSDRLPCALDSAMPAVAILRDLSRKGLSVPERHILIFWRHGRTATRLCDISAVAVENADHALVVFRPEGEYAATLAGRSADTPSENFEHPVPPANDDSPPRVLRDDAETLKEIARRIREGQRVRTATLDISSNTEVSRDELSPVDAAPLTEVLPRLHPEATETEPAVDTADNNPAHVMPPAMDRLNAALLEDNNPPVQHQSKPADPKPVRDLSRALPPEDIAKLAHELKTPLSAIAAAAEIMRDERLGTMGNEKYLGYAADIHDSATHALAVIADMLAGVPLAARQHLRDAAFDLADLAARSVSALQPLAAQRALTLSHDTDGSLLKVRANATSVRQILLNLLTNALKFTPSGGDVRVGTGYLDDGAVFLVVRDTGDGMTGEALTYAFDDTTDAHAMRAGGGRGIGLRLVRRLAAENGAEFEIDSQLGRGTIVMLVFPKDLVGEH